MALTVPPPDSARRAAAIGEHDVAVSWLGAEPDSLLRYMAGITVHPRSVRCARTRGSLRWPGLALGTPDD